MSAVKAKVKPKLMVEDYKKYCRLIWIRRQKGRKKDAKRTTK